MIIAVAMPVRWREAFFTAPDWDRLESLGEVRVLPEPLHLTPDSLTGAEVLVTGWGTPHISSALVAQCPDLRVIVHSGGTVRSLIGSSVYKQGILVSSQAHLNAIPVAEFCLAQTLLAAKKVPRATRMYHETHSLETFTSPWEFEGSTGVYAATVGLIGYGKVCHHLMQLLQPFEMNVLVSSPYISHDLAEAMGVSLVTMEEAMQADVVSIHLGATPDNHGAITAHLLSLIGNGATFINTARGIVVDEDALVRELSTGRFDAVLDVTWPEVPPDDSPLWTLPNVTLTPHWAGSLGNELYRLGHGTVMDVEQWVEGKPLSGAVDPALAPFIA